MTVQLIASIALICSVVWGSFEFGREFESGKQAQILAEQQAESAKQLQAKNDQIHKQAQEHADEVRTINTRLADALERLRKRPERLPEPSRKACEGSTGRELAGVDAAFLERYAARAAEQESALRACYAWIDTVE